MHDVMGSINRCSPHLLMKVSVNGPMPTRIDTDQYRYFSDCIGAIDGTHIDAVVPNTDEFLPYRN